MTQRVRRCGLEIQKSEFRINGTGKRDFTRNLNRRVVSRTHRGTVVTVLAHRARQGSTPWRPLVSVDLTSDEASATGSRQRFAHARARALSRNDRAVKIL